MRQANVYMHDCRAGVLSEVKPHAHYRFQYEQEYQGPPVSLTMPVRDEPYEFERFPPFFDGLLPEGFQLDALLKYGKLDRSDLFGQLLAVGLDLVGAVTVKPVGDG